MSTKAWSDEDEAKLIQLYTADQIKDPEVLAEQFEQKNHRSIISKLVQLGIYEKPNLAPLEKPATVKTMIRKLEQILEIEIDGVNLTKKENLVKLVAAIEKKLAESIAE